MKKLFLSRLTTLALDRPKTIISTVIIITVLFGLQFLRIKIDTDPENMLESNQADRVFYNQVKQDFGIRDLIVVGISDKKGVFSSESLNRIAEATDDILEIPGVIIEDVISLTTTDNVLSENGVLNVRPVMSEIPQTKEDLLKL